MADVEPVLGAQYVGHQYKSTSCRTSIQEHIMSDIDTGCAQDVWYRSLETTHLLGLVEGEG